MTERNPVVVMLLCVLTCGLYGLYWLWASTKELADATGREDLMPGVDLLLTIGTVGLWGVYAAYRNAKVVHEELGRRGERRDDKSAIVLLFCVLTYAVGFAWVVGVGVLQEELNVLASRLPRARLPGGDPATDVPLPVTY